MTLKQRMTDYWKETPIPVVSIDVARAVVLVASPFLAVFLLRWFATTDLFLAPVHRRLWANPANVQAGVIYRAFLIFAIAGNAAWMLRAARNFVLITIHRTAGRVAGGRPSGESAELPPWPYRRDSFAVVLGELQGRDGSRVPSSTAPDLKPRWLILPELSLYTGVFVTGGIGSGKTSAVAYPALRQLLGFRRDVPIRRRDGTTTTAPWVFSGLIMDEKGDFTRAAVQYAEEWSRSGDVIRISPGGKWIWNVIYNPNLPSWAVAYQLGWILRNFNKGAIGSDPFWENAPKELATDYLGLLDDARGYYTISDYLETLVDDTLQNALHEQAMQRYSTKPGKVQELERRWKSIMKRRDEMSVNLRGALEACARAGIDMFRFPELRRTFCPTKDEYFERDAVANVLRPRANVFTGFDQALDYGRIVGLEMPKQIYFDAAVFVQVALKSQWQDAVLRREAIGPDGSPLMPPRFGERIGYCPTFLMADEAQQSATPRDAEFKAVSRSKRASLWELTQSHGSIKGAFGPANAAHAATYFQNSMTHVYLRQSDLDSMKTIQEECGKKLVQRTSLAVTEGGTASELSYVQGEIVHQGLGISSTKTVATEERPFLEVDELKQLPNNVAVVLPSNGDRTLPATITFLRPLWIQKKYPELPVATSWLDWPSELRTTYDLDTIPQELNWPGWSSSEPLDEGAVIPMEDRLGKLIQAADEEQVVSASPTLPPLSPPSWQASATREPPPPAPVAPEPQPEPPPPYIVSAVQTEQRPAPDPLEQPREGDPFAGFPDEL